MLEDYRFLFTVQYTWLTFGVLVAEGRGSHVTQPQGALTAAVHQHVAVVRVELC